MTLLLVIFGKFPNMCVCYRTFTGHMFKLCQPLIDSVYSSKVVLRKVGVIVREISIDTPPPGGVQNGGRAGRQGTLTFLI